MVTKVRESFNCPVCKYSYSCHFAAVSLNVRNLKYNHLRKLCALSVYKKQVISSNVYRVTEKYNT